MKIRFLRRGKTFSRQTLEAKLREVMPRLQASRILDIGSKKAPYRAWVKCERFDTLDIVAQHNPDVIGDIHCLPVRDNVYDAVIATQVLEHCHTPHVAIREVERVLKPGGALVLSVPFIYVVHGDPHDYWRYTEYALRELLKSFENVEIWPLGNHFTSAWDLLANRRRALLYLNNFLPIKSLSRPDPRCPHGYLVLAYKR